MAARGAPCEEDDDCIGCEACLGRAFWCPVCEQQFTRRSLYGSGSGAFTINGDPTDVRVYEFPHCLERLACVMDAQNPQQQPINSMSMITYLGDTFCACCQLDNHHQYPSKQCGQRLNSHQDNIATASSSAFNSQKRTVNYTYTIGHARVLTMRLGDHFADAATSMNTWSHAKDFTMGHNSLFSLMPADETLQFRTLNLGRVGFGSFSHGMESPLPGNHGSNAWVGRVVQNYADVYIDTNLMAVSPVVRAAYEATPQRFNHPPSGVPHEQTAKQAFDSVRKRWTEHEGPKYSASIHASLKSMFAEWRRMSNGV